MSKKLSIAERNEQFLAREVAAGNLTEAEADKCRRAVAPITEETISGLITTPADVMSFDEAIAWAR